MSENSGLNLPQAPGRKTWLSLGAGVLGCLVCMLCSFAAIGPKAAATAVPSPVAVVVSAAASTDVPEASPTAPAGDTTPVDSGTLPSTPAVVDAQGTGTPAHTPVFTHAPTDVPTVTDTPTSTDTPLPTDTPTQTTTPTPPNTPTGTATPTATGTNTPAPTATPTLTQIPTRTNTPVPTPTRTFTPTPTPTRTNTPIPTPTRTFTPTPTRTPTVLIDFVREAPRASWNSGPIIPGQVCPSPLPFPGGLGDSCGFAYWWQGNATMEDGSHPALALETHPKWVNNGFITGNYTRTISLQSGDRLRTTLGFLQNAGAGNVTFSVTFTYPGCGEFWCTANVYALTKAYNGTLVSNVTSLSSQAGRSGQFILQVDAGATSAQDWATWVVAQVERP